MRKLSSLKSSKPKSLKKGKASEYLRTLSIPGFHGKSRAQDSNHGRVFLGLDPSLRGFGMAVVAESGLMLPLDTIRVSQGKDALSGMLRVKAIVDRLKETVLVYKSLCKTGLYKGLVVVREDYAYHKNDAADTPLKELGGIVEWELHKMDIPLYRLNITTIKKFATGRGNVDKTEVPDIVYRNYGFDSDEDGCHAFAAAITQMALMNPKITGLTKEQREALSGVSKKGQP